MDRATGRVRSARRRAVVLSVVSLVLLLAVGGATSSADGPICALRGPEGSTLVNVCPPHLTFEADSTVAPTALPRFGRAPIAFHLESRVVIEREERPPALQEEVLELDKYVRLDASEFRACRRDLVAHGVIARARQLCSGSIVGVGRARVELEDPESGALRNSSSRLTIFAGGSKGMTSTLLFRFEPPAPSDAPLLAVAKSQAIERGRLGTRMTIPFPQIADGSGSIVSLGFGLRRRVPGGHEAGIVSARCPDEHLDFRLTGIFVDGTRLVGSSLRACATAPPAPPHHS